MRLIAYYVDRDDRYAGSLHFDGDSRDEIRKKAAAEVCPSGKMKGLSLHCLTGEHRIPVWRADTGWTQQVKQSLPST